MKITWKEKIKKSLATFTVLQMFVSLLVPAVTFAGAPNLPTGSTVLVGWNFPSSSSDALVDQYSPLNSDKLLTAVDTGTVGYSDNGYDGGSSDKAATAKSWDKNDYWKIKFDSTGYTGLKLYSKQRNDSKGPKDFKIQYKIGSGNVTDLPAGGYEITNASWNNASNNSWTLPSSLDNKTLIEIRFKVTSEYAATGQGDIDKDDYSSIDDIYVVASGVTIIDTDSDGVPDSTDNCPYLANSNQANNDGDSMGDVCDPDDDNDGILDTVDNCPVVANANQADNDLDGLGDACDPDDDNDTVLDTLDNCSFVANLDQNDNDGDGQGDLCDIDDDNDEVLDLVDNCSLITNSDQSDIDDDGKGDACDLDIDGDGFENDVDNCRIVYNPDQIDTDTDGLGDECDPDLDQDGITNNSDNCVFIYNPTQQNTDGDEYGDACDIDDDNDGVLDIGDNCPLLSNSEQENNDNDSMGDVCDTDDDNDTILDTSDNCLLIVNENQTDTDGDGFGDVCDPDDDNDGVLDEGEDADNCPLVPNADQVDIDGDRIGDACDNDSDNDNIVDDLDNCILVFNPNQEDTFGSEELGDACEENMSPLITLIGDAIVFMEYGESYVEEGATWEDLEDGSGAAAVSGETVNNLVLGSYVIRYNYTDTYGNVAEEVTRTVFVVPRAITITALSQTKFFGSVDPTLGFTITAGNLISGDVLTGALSRVTGEAVGNYTINQGTLGNPNYNILFMPSTLTILAVIAPSGAATVSQVATPVVAQAQIAPVTETETEEQAVAGSQVEANNNQNNNLEDEGEVKGSTDTTCPWWWIILLASLVVLAFLGGIGRGADNDRIIRKYYYVWPVLTGSAAWLLHTWLHNDYAATWFCNNYLLVILILVALSELVFYNMIGRKAGR